MMPVVSELHELFKDDAITNHNTLFNWEGTLQKISSIMNLYAQNIALE
jgi:hypothetical protein